MIMARALSSVLAVMVICIVVLVRAGATPEDLVQEGPIPLTGVQYAGYVTGM